MATVDKGGTATIQALISLSLAQADALAKLVTEKGVITEAEHVEKLKAERGT